MKIKKSNFAKQDLIYILLLIIVLLAWTATQFVQEYWLTFLAFSLTIILIFALPFYRVRRIKSTIDRYKDYEQYYIIESRGLLQMNWSIESVKNKMMIAKTIKELKNIYPYKLPKNLS